MTFHVLLPLISGIVIYILFRKDTWFHQYFFSGQAKFPLIGSKSTAIKVIAFNLPDFCWSYSLSAALFTWKKWSGASIRYFPLLVLLALLSSEVIQILLTGLFTFDWIDVLAAFIAFLLSYYFLFKK
ncbi:MAG: hypothetical protein JNK27_08245 [Chitinophagaceae bacterium]|nr:hypothetical protein [Chitinophagaceae bacterium]